jgi:hypothetical protein
MRRAARSDSRGSHHRPVRQKSSALAPSKAPTNPARQTVERCRIMTTPKSVSWKVIAVIFHCFSIIYHDEGLTDVPRFDAVPSPAIDEDCDEWCRKLASDLRIKELPPPHIRGWMFARLLLASTTAKLLQEQQEPYPGPLDSQLIERLLIHEWYGVLRHRWAQMDDYPRSASSPPTSESGSGTRADQGITP